MHRKPQLQKPFRLGDIADLEAFVYRIVKELPEPIDHPDDIEELVSQGLKLAVESNNQLVPSQSLQYELSGQLGWRLQDHWRTLHRELRRNSRAGTTTVLDSATGLSGEHGEDSLRSPAPGTERLALSLSALASITNASQLRDPHLIAQFASGGPSHTPLPTGRSNEIFAEIIEERLATGTPTLNVLLDPNAII